MVPGSPYPVRRGSPLISESLDGYITSRGLPRNHQQEVSVSTREFLPYLIGTEIPWAFRSLSLAVLVFIIIGVLLDIRASTLSLPTNPAVAGATPGTPADSAAGSPAVWEFRRSQFLRLTTVADKMYDFAKIAFGVIIGALSGLVTARGAEAGRTSVEQSGPAAG